MHKNINTRTQQSGNIYFVFDANLAGDITDNKLFEHIKSNQNNKTAIGRGAAVFFQYKKNHLVYKHYQRGGLVAKLLHDQYIGIKIESTRAFREWYLLHQMQELGLPSPVPVAARVIKNGWLYTADLVMQEIQDAKTLADYCLSSDVSTDIWRNIGQCIKQFHDKDVYHADLNARNILIAGNKADNKKIHLVDFDKSCIRLFGGSWKISNLSRLNRSLEKFKRANDSFYYTPSDWNQLLSGYNDSAE